MGKTPIADAGGAFSEGDRFGSDLEYTFKQEDLDRSAAQVGQYYPVDYREQLTLASHDTMRNFARSYGDDNPLYVDEYYGRKTRWKSQIAPPLIVHILNKPMRGEPAPKRVAFRGIHLFVSGTSTEWYQQVREGDILYRFGGMESEEMKSSAFADKSLIQKQLLVHINQRAEVVAISRTTRILTERKAARKKKKYAALEPATYNDQAIAQHDDIYAAEEIRGTNPRFWEDVAEGDILQPRAKGPFTVTDCILFHAGGYGFHYKPGTSRLWYKNRKRIPAFYINNEQGVPDVSMRVHWDKAWAQAIGNPMPYDYGMMRDCWLSHIVTDWMGDDAFLVRMSSQIRKFNYLGDLHVIHGRIEGKRIVDGLHVVDIRASGINQRDTETCFADITVALPSRRGGLPLMPRAPQDMTDKAAELMERHWVLESAAVGD